MIRGEQKMSTTLVDSNPERPGLILALEIAARINLIIQQRWRETDLRSSRRLKLIFKKIYLRVRCVIIIDTDYCTAIAEEDGSKAK